MYPVNGDWSNCRPSHQETVRYYHASKECVTNRFTYFSVDYIEIPNGIKDSLRDSHKTYLTSEFGLRPYTAFLAAKIKLFGEGLRFVG